MQQKWTHRVLRVIVLTALPAMLMPQAYALTNPVLPGSLTIKLQLFAQITTGGEPLDLAWSSDGPGRIFIATHGGHIRLVENGVLQSTPFLNIPSTGVPLVGGTSSDERGLLGLAFHPDFNVAGSPGYGKFYTYTSESISGNADFGHPEIALNGGNHQSVIREWTATPGSNSANTTSRVVMRIMQPQSNHNGGAVRFGADKYLYIALGDGGGANDFGFGGNPSTPTDGHTNGTGNGQDPTNVYGTILRIDPLDPALTSGSSDPVSANGKYRIPSSNPFISSATNVKEIFAYGFRNPFRFSFDRLNSNLYVGDVGQGQREEVDLVTSGGNYGWPYLEGTLDNPNYAPSGAGTVLPIAEYTHSDGISIIGGYVYRGDDIPGLVGKYVFGDYQKPSTTTGRLFYMDLSDGVIREFLYDPTGLTLNSRLYSIGEDAEGELYALLLNGSVLKIVPEPAMTGAVSLATLMLLPRRRLQAESDR